MGISAMATIPDPSPADCNGSPMFTIPPPTAFCTNFPISYDQSATDPDGDSLVYEFCSATTGADAFNPYPNPPATTPPYVDDISTSAFSQGIFQVQLLGENISVTKSIIIQK